jgi:hypothetical protein
VRITLAPYSASLSSGHLTRPGGRRGSPGKRPGTRPNLRVSNRLACRSSRIGRDSSRSARDSIRIASGSKPIPTDSIRLRAHTRFESVPCRVNPEPVRLGSPAVGLQRLSIRPEAGPRSTRIGRHSSRLGGDSRRSPQINRALDWIFSLVDAALRNRGEVG